MGELPVFTCQAHVFAINPTTKKSWLPSSSKAVDVNVFYDHTKQCHRIISVEDTPTGKKVIINSTLTEKMAFKKTSQKFGQWADTKTGGVHGLGFSSEAELTEFANHFKQYVEASKSPPAMSVIYSVTKNGVSNCLTDVLPSLPGGTSQTLLPQTLSQLTSNQLTLNSGSTLCYTSPPLAASLFAPKSFSTNLTQTLSDTSPKPALDNVVSPDLTSSSRLQVQLAQAQAQVRRIEAELSATKHQVVHAEHSTGDLGQPSSNGSHVQDYRTKLEPLTNGVAPTPLSAGVVTGAVKTQVEKWVDDNFSGSPRTPTSPSSTASPGLMTLVDKQLQLTGVVGGPSRGEEEKTSLEWLYHRLGVILHEAVDLHTRIGVLLAISPSRQPSVYRSPPSG